MICDSVDAMLSDRPYRKALSVEVVRQELGRCAGSQFDPRIVDIMLTKGTLERAAETAALEKSTASGSPARLIAVG
jgi:HD-GYP domain-containing protein (c-di-GMP phosphodiesterase class II)